MGIGLYFGLQGSTVDRCFLKQKRQPSNLDAWALPQKVLQGPAWCDRYVMDDWALCPGFWFGGLWRVTTLVFDDCVGGRAWLSGFVRFSPGG